MRIREFRRRGALLRFKGSTWSTLMSELERRGKGERESGAFLLASSKWPQVVEVVVPYDELDPACLTGGIDFHRSGYQRLWTRCEHLGLCVVGDAHTHPSKWVSQSEVDRRHPMLARVGHVALIVPNFAQGDVPPAEIGVHVYQGDQGWAACAGRHAHKAIYVGPLA
jgi:proteasome lid subunit RPN8/RPN11